MLAARYRPEKIYFEVTNFCNFHCDFCPSDFSRRARRHMDFNLFRKGIDEIAREKITRKIGFHILGEPLVYPQINEAVRYVTDKGLRAEINTNGSLLTAERVEALLSAGVSLLAISVQMIGEEDHACRGSNMPFDVYYRRVLDAVRQIHQSGREVDVLLCFMNPSLKRLFDIDSDMRIHWGREIDRQKLNGYIQDIAGRLDQQFSPEEIRQATGKLNLNAPQTIRISEHVQVFVHPVADWGNAFTRRKVFPAKLGFCGYSLTNVGVLNTGELTICCPDYDGQTSLGNIQDASIAELLTSEKAEKIRAGFARMSVTHPYCQRCIGSTHPLKAIAKGLLSVYLFKGLDFSPTRLKGVSLLKEAKSPS